MTRPAVTGWRTGPGTESMNDHLNPASRGHGRWLAAVCVFLVAAALAGLTADRLLARDGTYSYLRLFNEVLLLVRNSYVEKVEMGHVMHGAYDGLLGTLDPQTEYISREQYARLQGGEPAAEVGIDLSRRGGYLYVVSVLPGSPADEAGIQGGMRVRRIQGRSTRELTLTDAELMLRGPAGAKVTLQRFPGGEEPEEITLTLRPVEVPLPRLEREGDAAVLRVGSLVPGAAQAMRESLGKVASSDTLIVDLRGVSRGDYDEAVTAASLFLGSTQVGAIRGRSGEERPLKTRRERGTANPARMAVLVDRGTAGPAELLAQALRLQGDRELLGGRTFGRGTLQELIPLNDGGYLRLSVQRCVDAEGNAWDGSGLTPDHVLEQREDSPSWVAQALEILDAPVEERPAA